MTARRLWLIVPWALFALIAIGWIIYWNVVAGTAEARVRAWAAQQTEQGGQVSIGRIARHGFPVLLRLELHTSLTRRRAGAGARRQSAQT